MAVVYVVLGSNIAPEQNLVRAVALLRGYGNLVGLSSVYQTSPQGDPNQADFLNMAVCLQTTYPIETFKTKVIGEIEQQLGRERDPHNKNAPRTIDLDIALWDSESRDYGSKPWHVPEADILRFAHVALPLAELAPDYLHPEKGQTLGQIAARFLPHGFILRGDIDFS